MSLEVDVLSIGYYCPRYWTLWIGRVCAGSYNDPDYDEPYYGAPGGGSCLLKIGTRGSMTSRFMGCRLVFDILWLSWPIMRLRAWLYRRRRQRELERATQYEPYCACGHTVHSHCTASSYFIGPCQMCECEDYQPVECPRCACGHAGAEHTMVGYNLYLGCEADDCKCVKYAPMDVMEDVGRMIHEVLDELGTADGAD